MMEIIDLGGTKAKGLVLARWPDGVAVVRALVLDDPSFNDENIWAALWLVYGDGGTRSSSAAIEHAEHGVVGTLNDSSRWRIQWNPEHMSPIDVWRWVWFCSLTMPPEQYAHILRKERAEMGIGELTFDPSPWLLLGELTPAWSKSKVAREWAAAQNERVMP